MQVKSTDVITICGMRGTGKSQLGKYLMKQMPSSFIFDTLDEHREFQPNVYIPKTNDPKELNLVAGKIWRTWNTYLYISEAELFMPVNRPLLPETFRITTQGRHRGIGLLADTRRVADLNKTVFSLSDHVFIFRQFSKNDVHYLEECGFVYARQTRELPDWWFFHLHRNVVTLHKPIRLE